MAYQTTRTKKDLEMECLRNGILDNVKNYNEDKRTYKDDFIRALRDYYIDKNYDGNPPKSIELLDENLISPMLAARFNQLKEEQQEEIWESDEWYFEEKEDGVRMLISFLEEEGFNFYSRNISVEDFLPISYGDTIYTEDIDKSKIEDEFIVDSELISLNPNISTIVEDNKGVVTETQLDAISSLISMEPEKAIPIQKRESTKLQFVIFDIIYWNGEWLFDLPLKERRDYLEKAVKQLESAGMECRLPRSNRSKKKQFYKNIITEGGEGCFKGDMKVLLSDGSEMRIDKIVKNKLDVEVLSYNYESNKIESKKIVGWYNNGLKSVDDWVKVKASTRPGGKGKTNKEYYNSIYCTRDHEYAVDDNGKYQEIDDLDVNDYLLGRQLILSDNQKQVILGHILGDGYISNNRFGFDQSKSNEDYFDYNYRIFEGFIGSKRESKSGKGSVMYRMDLFKKESVDRYLNSFTDSEGNILLNNVLKDLDDIGLAVYFMDDGNSCYRGRGLAISMHSFTEKEVNSFIDWLLDKYEGSRDDITIRRDNRVNNGDGLSIRIHVDLSSRIINRIGKYIHPSMRYKVSNIDDIDDFTPIITKYKYDLVKLPITKKTEVVKEYLGKHSNNITAYDIEVEDNHNYFINNVLVHNCIAKNINYKYIPNSYRRKNGWIKIKRSMSESIGMENTLGDSIDAWVSGFKVGTEGKKWENYVGALEFSVYLEDFEDALFNDAELESEVHKIAVVASIPDDMRKDMTDWDDDGNPILKKEWYGKVAELDGQSVSARSQRLRHARIINWRRDKSPNECRMDFSWLHSMIL